MQFLNDARKAQNAMDLAVRTGDIKLADKLIELKLGVPNLDIAAKANQLAMLKHLNDLEKKEGKFQCKATKRLAEYAARTGNSQMFFYVANHCDKHFLGDSLRRAAREFRYQKRKACNIDSNGQLRYCVADSLLGLICPL